MKTILLLVLSGVLCSSAIDGISQQEFLKPLQTRAAIFKDMKHRAHHYWTRKGHEVAASREKEKSPSYSNQENYPSSNNPIQQYFFRFIERQKRSAKIENETSQLKPIILTTRRNALEQF